MKKLLKQYDFNSDMQYYEMVATSFENGQITQAYEQFKAMPKNDRVSFLKAAMFGNWSSGIQYKYLENLLDII